VPILHHRDLNVWQRSIELVSLCYTVTRRFPASERFGLCSQIQRAAISIPANIAEGHGRSGRGEYLHHLSIARGSLRELETLFVIVDNLRLCPQSTLGVANMLADDVGRMLHGLMQKLKAAG
jgi:four helix bundle protein